MNVSDLRVLVVEDEPFTQGTIKQMLRVVGVREIKLTDSGESALELIGDFKPDVVLCDVAMKPMSGLEFLKKLRDHADTAVRETSVIMLTAHTAEKVVNEARRLRASGYLVKPVSPKQLSARLEAVAGQKSR